MKILPYIVFSFLLLCALCAGVNSYCCTEHRIKGDKTKRIKVE